jgi:hypothetical protein
LDGPAFNGNFIANPAFAPDKSSATILAADIVWHFQIGPCARHESQAPSCNRVFVAAAFCFAWLLCETEANGSIQVP